MQDVLNDSGGMHRRVDVDQATQLELVAVGFHPGHAFAIRVDGWELQVDGVGTEILLVRIAEQCTRGEGI